MGSPIYIKGIELGDMSIKQSDKGEPKVNTQYKLISNAGKVLATQSIGGWSAEEMNLVLSEQTVASLTTFLQSYKADVEKAIGITTT